MGDYKTAWESLKLTLQEIYISELSPDHEAAVFATLMVMNHIEEDTGIKKEEQYE